MSRRLAELWRWSWLVTVPGVVFFAYWATTTWSQWCTLVRDVDPSPIVADLHSLGAERADTILRQLRLRVTPGNLVDVPEAEQLRSVQMFLGDSERDDLDADLPESGRTWVKALLAYDDGLREVKVRYRGDLVTHWGFDKKSMRVKTAATDLFAGMREFNLSVPRFPLHGENVLASSLARRLGLVTARCEYVNGFRNGHFLGVFECTEQIDEGTLRAHDRMPGDVYAGEATGRDRRAGVTDAVFATPGTWTKLAENNHYALGSRAPLEALCTLLAQPQSEAAHARLLQLVDAAAFGRFLAFELLAQSAQCTETRDWRLFWDPWRCRFEPVVQDPAGWRETDAATPVRIDQAASRLQAWLLANGDVLAARHAALRDFLGSGKAAAFLAEVDTTTAKLRAALALDANVRPASGKQIEAALRSLGQRIEHSFAALAEAHLRGPTSQQWQAGTDGAVHLVVSGRSTIDEIELRYATLVAPTRIDVVWVGGAGEAQLVPCVPHCDGVRVRVPVRWAGRMLASPSPQGAPTWSAEPVSYELRVHGVPADASVQEVAVTRQGATHVAVPAAAGAVLPRVAATGWFRAMPPARPEPETWRGEVVVEGTREVVADVRIEAGTVVRLRPKANLLFRGRVLAEGEPQLPIRFEPYEPGQDPWGTVALDGAGCNGSQMRHCVVSGGSGMKVPLAEYCSMFSLHGCRQVRVTDCTFRDNHQYDDVVHVMYAQVVFERVVLEGARADALDCDISDVVIRDSAFVRSVNDGVDLMTTQALVENCRFIDNGDKGVSIGEGSTAAVLRCTFDGCGKGVEAKDGSVAHVLHCDLLRCRKVANAYKKNWRYGAGGALVLQRCVVRNELASFTADTWSRVEVVDSIASGTLVAEYDQEYVDGTSTRMRNTARLVACSEAERAERSEPPAFPPELEVLRTVAASAWAQAIGARRGAAR